MSEDQITAEGLSFSYFDGKEETEVIRDFTFSFERGAFVSIIGPSGCGKTSLLRLIAGLEEPTRGTLNIADNVPSDSSIKCGFVFQSASLFPWLSVADNIAKPLKLAGDLKSTCDVKVGSLLEMVGLEDFRDKYPHQLSGGMQQRVSIARALAMDPDMLLMDEPFGALDEITREKMNAELYALWMRTGKTICFVTHSISEAAFLSSRILVMSARPGRMVEDFKSPLPKIRDGLLLETKEFSSFISRIRQSLRSVE